MRRLLPLLICSVTLLLMAGCGGGDNGTPNPEISTLQPDSGPPGTMVTIDGSGFSPDTSANSVTFGGTAAPVSSASESSIETTVPDLSSGSAPVEVTVGDQTASGPAFTVEQAAPGISAVEPDSGTVGTEVTITGMNFSATASENSISFAGTDAPVNSAAEDELVTEVPQGATDGPVEVTVKQKSTTGPDFDVITEGAVEVTTTTTGSDKDSDGYTVTAGSQSTDIATSGSAILANLPEGDTDVELTGIASNCEVDGSNPETVTITAGDTTSSTFNVKCQAVANNQIAFVSYRNSEVNLFVMEADGSSPMQVVSDPVDNNYVKISHDGTKIAFFSDAINPPSNALYTVNVDGSNLQQVTSVSAEPTGLSWSPDGSKLVFSDYDPDGNEIFTVNTDGTGMTQLTDNTATQLGVDWSPDGSKIAFTSDRSGNHEIYTMNPDGSGVQQLTNTSSDERAPAWSPDGSKIAFHALDGSNKIYTIDADGSNRQQITSNNTLAERYPSWSPDGSELVFVSDRDGNPEVYKINADGSGTPSRLTSNSVLDRYAHWSPLQ